MKDQHHEIIKADGRKSPFLEERLITSLERVGANEELIRQITRQVQEQLTPPVKTNHIYRLVYNELRKRSRPLAARYKLRRAVYELGPSGYPFEAYVGEIFRHLGYDVRVGIVEKGRCVQHEIDVLADKNGRRISVECKFGNSSSRRIDVKVPLYIYARFVDLKQAWKQESGDDKREYEGWIVTNVQFTDDAIQYGKCAGLRMVSWRYPQEGNLQNIIEHSALYPVTVLASLTNAEKKHLLKQNIVLAKALLHRRDLLQELQMSPTRIRRCMEEVEGLCY